MIKVLLALVLLAHGIGHSLGPLQLFRIATVNPQWNGDSWLLSAPGLSTAGQVIGLVVWIAALLGFVAVAAVIVGWLPASWWQPLAVGSALASLIGLALFPVAFPPFSSIAAAVVDIALLVAVLGFRWTPAQLPA